MPDPVIESPELTEEVSEPWFTPLEANEEDKGIYSKYKTDKDALKSIPARERMITKLNEDRKIDFPAENTKPEEARKQHRAILSRMGAPKDAAGYKTIVDGAVKNLPEDLKGKIPPSFFDKCMEEAAEVGSLPWQFERQLAVALSHIESNIEGDTDTKIDRQDELERSLKVRHGLHWTEHVRNSELVAAQLDEVLVQNPKGLLGADGQPVKNAFTQLMKECSSPVLHAAMDHLYDVLLSEGNGGGPRQFGGTANDAFSDSYNEAKSMWPNRGHEVWSKYAKEKTGGGR